MKQLCQLSVPSRTFIQTFQLFIMKWTADINECRPQKERSLRFRETTDLCFVDRMGRPGYRAVLHYDHVTIMHHGSTFSWRMNLSRLLRWAFVVGAAI